MYYVSVLIFDLDDTLYPEISYVHSGFQAVAKYLSEYTGYPQDYLFYCLVDILEQDGRGYVFNKLLSELGIGTKHMVSACLNVYRNHKPSISLSLEVKNILKKLNSNRIYLVTDGNKIVQHKKVSALNLSQLLDGIYITHRYGVKNAKPSTYCFELIINKEKCKPSEAVYIGDNPKKDFVNIKKMGFRTIRVMTGAYKDFETTNEFEAEFRIFNIRELPQLLNKINF